MNIGKYKCLWYIILSPVIKLITSGRNEIIIISSFCLKTSDCQDKRDMCVSLKAMDYCRLMASFMENYCRRTCGLCTKGKVPTVCQAKTVFSYVTFVACLIVTYKLFLIFYSLYKKNKQITYSVYLFKWHSVNALPNAVGFLRVLR